MSSFKRSVHWEPGHDCLRFECKVGSPGCRPGSGGSHGIGGMKLRFVLRGNEGAVSFLLHTGWLPEPDLSCLLSERGGFVMPMDLGYHSLKPTYEGQNPGGVCEHLDGEVCYYDGSGLNAEEPFRVLCNEGDEAMWSYLEAYFRHVFRGAPFPKGKSYRFARREEGS